MSHCQFVPCMFSDANLVKTLWKRTILFLFLKLINKKKQSNLKEIKQPSKNAGLLKTWRLLIFLQLSFHTIDSYISLVTYSILKFLTPPKTRKWPDPFIYSRWSHFSPFIWSIISLACFHLAPPHSFWDGPSLPQRLRVCFNVHTGKNWMSLMWQGQQVWQNSPHTICHKLYIIRF